MEKYGTTLTIKMVPALHSQFQLTCPMNQAKDMSTIHIIDDDDAVRNSLSILLNQEGYKTREFPSAIEFLNAYNDDPGCIVSDIEMPDMTGIELQKTLKKHCIDTPIIFITGHGNISMSVDAIKSGAIDFPEKPFVNTDLFKSIDSALAIDSKTREIKSSQQIIQCRCEMLTPREKQILIMLTKDHAKLTNQAIADQLGISKRTVEVHRSSVMSKMHAQTRAELVELHRFCNLD